MRPFVFPGIGTRVVFGSGTIETVGEELARLGHDGALVLANEQQRSCAEQVSRHLGPLSAGVFAGAVMHTPVAVTEKATEVYRTSGATAVVSIGGGSVTGLGKAIAMRTAADQIVLPTTYAGSEMTDILGETADGTKVTRRSPDIRPETVIYDVDLTLTLPVGLTVTSAMNAIAHAVEALYAPDRNPILELFCRDAIAAFRTSIPTLIAHPEDRDARSRALYAAWGCSTALGYASMGFHHKLAHVLGGSFETPHAETHAILLPHTTAFNEVAVPDLLKPVAEIFAGRSAAESLWDFAEAVNAPRSLQAIGLSQQDLDKAADIAVQNSYENPRKLERSAIRSVLQKAWEGRRPSMTM